jgi:hypothetical protein
MEKAEFNGYWWLPERPERMLPGTLIYDPEQETRLTTIGSFVDLNEFQRLNRVEMILGVSTNGKIITLHNLIPAGLQITAPGLTSANYIASVVFLGHHFQEEPQMRFRSLSIRYPHILEWTGFSGFRIEVPVHSKQEGDQLHVHYRFPETLTAQVPGALISLDYRYQMQGDYRNEVELRQRTFVKITLEQAMSLHDLWNQFQIPICNYLTFAIGIPLSPLELILTSDNAMEEAQKGEPRAKEIEVLVQTQPTAAGAGKSRAPHEMLFHLSALGTSFQTSLNLWFEKAQALEPAFKLYFGTIHGQHMYLEHQFLSLAQALETFHRRVYGGFYLGEEEFAAVLQALSGALPSNVPSNVATSYKMKLEFLNEYSLRKRLKNLVEAAGKTARFLIPRPDDFVQRMTNTRHFLTHYDNRLRGSSAEGEDLFWLIQQAKFLFEVLLMREIGFPSELIKTLVEQNERYIQYRARISKTSDS